MADSINYEQLDLFYLGREIDVETGKESRVPLLLKSKNLTTHAAIIGMTGSGKTGLGIALLEEAAIDRIPAIIIDPKGDMANLLLSFPDLAPADFFPWVDAAAAEQKKVSVEQLAENTAATWAKGLAGWDQDKDRIQRMRESAEFAVYTPGSSAGRPVSILDSLEAPSSDAVADSETAANMVNATVSSLLGLLGIVADPLKSREHVLLSTILLSAWQQGQSLNLEAIINAVMQPAFKQIGVFPLESFYPQAKRMELAMQLNTLVASPAFASWIKGEPLRIDNFLYSREGKPRLSIFSIAHLGDQERMFFVTMLLGRLISWMRRQEGSSGLRCLLYMDEIFGFFPPTANPPSKQPMLLLLKQARAFGLGVILSTQNPVDLDYKGLANIGTWFVGRLQTKQDQDRVMAGIGGSSAKFDEQALRRMVAGLKERQFLLYSAHREEPVLMATRWVLSYLKGPISLEEISKLEQRGEDVAQTGSPIPSGGTTSSEQQFSSVPPAFAASIDQYFAPSPVGGESLQLEPYLFGVASVRTVNQSRGIDQTTKICLQLSLAGTFREADWAKAEETELMPESLPVDVPAGALFAEVPAALRMQQNFSSEEKRLGEHIYRTQTLKLMRVKSLGLESEPGESENSFQQRVAATLVGKKEAVTSKIEEQYVKKQRQLEEQLEKAALKVSKEQGDVKEKGIETAISVGVAILGAFLGRKPLSVSTATQSARGVRSAGKLLKEKGDVQRAQEEVGQIEQEIALLGEELRQKLLEQSALFDPAVYPVETFSISPRKTDIFDVRVSLVWMPRFDFTSAIPPRAINQG